LLVGVDLLARGNPVLRSKIGKKEQNASQNARKLKQSNRFKKRESRKLKNGEGPVIKWVSKGISKGDEK